MKKITIILQIEKEGFIIREIEPVHDRNKLLMSLKNKDRKNE